MEQGAVVCGDMVVAWMTRGLSGTYKVPFGSVLLCNRILLYNCVLFLWQDGTDHRHKVYDAPRYFLLKYLGGASEFVLCIFAFGSFLWLILYTRIFSCPLSLFYQGRCVCVCLGIRF